MRPKKILRKLNVLKNLTIKTRLIFVLSFLALQLIAGAVIGLSSLSTANGTMQTMYDDRLVALGKLDQVMRLLNRNQTLLASALTLQGPQQAELLAQVDENKAVVSREWQDYRATRLTEEEATLASQFEQERNDMLTRGLQPAQSALRAGDLAKATELTFTLMPRLFAPIVATGDKLVQLQLTESARLRQEAQAHYELVRNVVGAGLLVGLLMAVGMGLWLVRSIVAPLAQAVQIAQGVAKGDLAQRIDVHGQDETGQLLQALAAMTAGLCSVVAQVRDAAATIDTASVEVATGSADLSVRTEQQAASLEETASSMEELTSTVQQNADNARQGSQMASTATTAAQQGGQVVAQVVSTMDAIEASAKRIADITSVIDGIAFQTNILALNAAVEAARAGEQGRGFAVVASEVRNLAQRSASAAREIKGLIAESTTQVQQGTSLAHEAGAKMEHIVQSVQRVTDLMHEISSASSEQASGIEQVSQAVLQLDQATQQNAALVEEASAASEAMRSETTRLTGAVGVFRLPA
jgi:methyl-accepting chemotaxis protein-1 (serine sensor receptor)